MNADSAPASLRCRTGVACATEHLLDLGNVVEAKDLLEQHTAETPFPLVTALRGSGLRVIDLGPTLGSEILNRGVEASYMPKGHHTPELNEFVAKQIARELGL